MQQLASRGANLLAWGPFASSAMRRMSTCRRRWRCRSNSAERQPSPLPPPLPPAPPQATAAAAGVRRQQQQAAGSPEQHQQQAAGPLEQQQQQELSTLQQTQQQQAVAAAARAWPPSPYELLVSGKRFLCTECGKCCTGSGEVWANEAECAALAQLLNLPEQHFLTRYTKSYSKRPGWRMLKTQPNGDCIFLQDGSKCSVYGARPLQCSTYPWWPELMDDASWATEGRLVCEGIEHEEAQEVDAAEAAAILKTATGYFAGQAVAAEEGRRKGRPRQEP